MKRKVIQLAGSTLVVSLPNRWAKEHSIRKGEEVEVKEKGKELVVSCGENQKEDEKAIIDASKISYFKQYLNYLYQKGIDEVEIRYDKQEIFPAVKSRVDRLIGFEIINHGKKFCIVRNVSQPLAVEFDNMLRRTFLLIKEMFSTLSEEVSSGSSSGLLEIRQLDRTINSFTDFLKRIINKEGMGSNTMNIYYYCIARDLERIGDEFKFICQLMEKSRGMCRKNHKTAPKKGIIRIIDMTRKYFNITYDSFYRFSKENIEAYYEIQKDLISSIPKEFSKGYSESELGILHFLFNIERHISEMFGPIFLLNMTGQGD